MAPEAFAVWITGLPASGKSTIARSLRDRLISLGIDVAIIESDELRKTLAPNLGYGDADRDEFYGQMVFLGKMMAKHGIPVIFDATANRRRWRDEARQSFANFIEVYVDVPLELCMARDPKGIYRQARAGDASHVPGVQIPYEPPKAPEVTIDWAESAASAANRIVSALIERDYVIPLAAGDAMYGEDPPPRHQ